MRLFEQLVMEGLIQHIDRMKIQVRDFVINNVVTKMLQSVRRLPDSDEAGDYLEQELFNYFPKVQLTTTTTRAIRRPSLDEVPVQYRKFYPQALEYWASTGPLRITCFFSKRKFGISGTGYYDPNINMIAINCSAVVERDYYPFVEAFNDNDANKVQALIIRLTSSIMHYVATAYHELIHYMQYSFVGHGHPQQQKMGKPADEDKTSYWTANLEVPAQIEGFAIRAKTWVLEYTRYFPKLSVVDFGRYVVGDINPQQLSEISGIREKLVPTALPAREFFMDLKRKRPSMYRRAVKYFMQKMH